MNVPPHPSRIERVPEDGDSFSVEREIFVHVEVEGWPHGFHFAGDKTRLIIS